MLPVEMQLHLQMNVLGAGLEINDLAHWAAAMKHELACQVVAAVLRAVQEQHLERVLRGEAELVCRGCGVISTGAGSVLRRGWRARKLRTSSGEIVFRLRQVTCSSCRTTWSPYPELLGVAPRQRIVEELERRLVDWVTQLSYQQTVGLGAAWLGATLSKRRLHTAVQRYGARVAFTESAPIDVLIADGTRVAAGDQEHGTDISFAFQLIGRTRGERQPRALKRVVGFGVGAQHLEQTLTPTLQPALVVTDRERGMHRLVSERFPRARHQQCTWHLVRALSYALWRDGMPFSRRTRLAATLGRILKHRPPIPAAAAYHRLLAGLGAYPKARAFLENSAPYVLYPTRSSEATTALVEREIREVNRRTDVAVRWSLPGIANLLRLQLAQRHNPDDYHRVWTPTRRIQWNLVSQT